MRSFRRPTKRWRAAVLVSGAVHLLILAAGVFWPSAEERDAVARKGNATDQRSIGIRLGSRSVPAGEEASEEPGGGFQSTFKTHLLIDPRLEPSRAIPKPAASSEGPPHLEVGTEPGPGDGKSTKAGKGVGTGKTGSGATFFGVGTEAKRIVYVVDASSSMGKDGLWRRASEEVILSIESLPADAMFQIIVYHSHAHSLFPSHPGWLTATAEMQGRVAKALHELMPEGRTVHAPALNLALAMRPDVVFFLTDADDLTFELLRQVDAWNHGKAVIHAFELNGATGPGSAMQMLAQRYRGEYRALRRP